MRPKGGPHPVTSTFTGYRHLIWRYLERQRGPALWMTLLLFGSIGTQLAAPRVVRGFIDAVKAGAPEAALYRMAVLFIGLAVATQVLNVQATYWSERVAWTASNALRTDLAAHLLRLDPSFYKSRTPGELIERVDGDVSALAGFLSSFVVKLLGGGLLLAGVLASMLLLNVPLGLAFVAFGLLAVAVLSRLRRIATPAVQENRERSAQFYGYLGEVMTAAEDLRSSGAVPYAMGRFWEHKRNWLPVRLRSEFQSSMMWGATMAVFGIGDAVAYGLGGGLYRSGSISMGTVYMVVAYAALLAHPLDMIRREMENLQRADASIGRIQELLATQPRIVDGDATLPAGPLSVELNGVRFQYADTASATAEYVLDDISFRLAPGRTMGLLGRTGSGKSTLARLLFRLYDPQEGEVRLGGVKLSQTRLREMRARVGLVTQDVQLFEASLRDNITFFNPAIADAHLHDVLAALGLKLWFDSLPQGLDTMLSGTSLSAGEAQLLAFARVFLYDPGLVILDEASSRLDPATEALLDRAVQRLLRNRTAILIAHRLATVEKVDDILILEDGRILEHGRRADLAADADSHFARLGRTGLEEVLR